MFSKKNEFKSTPLILILFHSSPFTQVRGHSNSTHDTQGKGEINRHDTVFAF